MALDEGDAWERYREDWKQVMGSSTMRSIEGSGEQVWSVWSTDFITQISRSKYVESVIALGSVLAINLQDDNAGTY